MCNFVIEHLQMTASENEILLKKFNFKVKAVKVKSKN